MKSHPTALRQLFPLASVWLSWTLLGLTVISMVAFGVMLYTPITPSSIFYQSGTNLTGFLIFPFLPFALFGALLSLRRPDNPIGWIAQIAILCLSLGGFFSLLGTLLTNSAPLFSSIALLGSVFWNGNPDPASSLLTLMILLFPTGHYPSPRWKWPVRLYLALGLLSIFLGLVNSAPSLGINSAGHSLLAIPGTSGVVNGLSIPMGILAKLFAFAVVGSLFFRLRGASSERRHQIKWVATAAAFVVIVLGIVVIIPFPNHPNLLFSLSFGLGVGLAALALPVALGVGIFKYHLYDIDIILNRAFVYGALAIFITVIYIGIAVGVGTLVGSGGQPNLWLSIIATIIVAVGFQPVRERLQKLANRLVYGQRASPYEVLARFSERVAESYAAEEVLPRMARVLAEGTNSEHAEVWLYQDQKLSRAASFPAETTMAVSINFSDSDSEELVIPNSHRATLVNHQGLVLGALSISKRRGETLTPIEVKLMDDLAHQAGLVLKNVGLSADLTARLHELRASRQRIVTAQDDERRRLERNLHDGAQQYLVAIKVKLGLVEMMVSKDIEKAKATLFTLRADADEALETLRDTARGIYPPLLADQGLVVALKSQAAKATLPVTIVDKGVQRYAPDIEATVYFCVLEALQNIQKYAQARNVKVEIQPQFDFLEYAVQDDGVGFDPARVRKGAGLTNMSDRLEALGGSLRLQSTPSQGTTIFGRVPLEPLAAAL